MWNPFQHYAHHKGIFAVATELTWALDELKISVQELREEVDYLAEFLDD
jgi:hypothetical protein